MNELSERKLQILKAIVDEYIETGVPVGSRALAKRSGLALSAATLRNEMADLEELGYLDKPHTSAGRRPTQIAYRLYADRLISVGGLTESEEAAIRSYFNGKTNDVEEVCKAAAEALSDLTDRIALVTTPGMDAMRLKRIQLVKLADSRAILILVTDTGLVRDAVVTIPPSITEKELERLSERLTATVADQPVDKAAQVIAEAVGRSVDGQKCVMDEVFEAIYRNKADREVFLDGRLNIWRYPEYQDLDKMRRFLSFLDEQKQLGELLKQTSDIEFSIRIGSEIGDVGLPDLSIVTATYKAGADTIGSFGVIGPARMNYRRVLSVLRSVGSSLSSLLGDTLHPDDND